MLPNPPTDIDTPDGVAAVKHELFDSGQAKELIEQVRIACGIPEDDLEFRRTMAKELFQHILIHARASGEKNWINDLFGGLLEHLFPHLGNPVAQTSKAVMAPASLPPPVPVTLDLTAADPGSPMKDPPPGYSFAAAMATVDEVLLECTRCSAGTVLINAKRADLIAEHDAVHTQLPSPDDLAARNAKAETIAGVP
ncbi:MAG TPA: hypothetical protein VMG81_00805 [Thermoplasmata archaeon]|nr:hypothetical protein [Thermoplasmata archaeon]